jgi:hypothetical protein
LVNVAGHVRGGQVGVVNVADDVDGESVALFSFVRTGYHPLALWSSDTSFANLGVKLGSRHLYTLWGAGITALDRDDRTRAYAAHVGLGGHFVPFGGRLFLDVDVMASSIRRDFTGDETSMLGALRLQLGYQLAAHMAVVGGPTFNVMTSWNGQDQKVGSGFLESVRHDGDVTMRLFPGLTLGLQI